MQRRIGILAIMLLAWAYSRAIAGNDALADIGAVSFSGAGDAGAGAGVRGVAAADAAARGDRWACSRRSLVWAWVLLVPAWSMAAADAAGVVARRAVRHRLAGAGCACSALTGWSRLGRAVAPEPVRRHAGHLAADGLRIAARRRAAAGGGFDARDVCATSHCASCRRPRASMCWPMRSDEGAVPMPVQQRIERELAAVLGAASARLLLDAARREQRPRPRYRRRHRRRSLAGPALQPARARSRAGEHEPGHQRGRRRAAPGGLEPPLRASCSAIRRRLLRSACRSPRPAGVQRRGARLAGDGDDRAPKSSNASRTCAPARRTCHRARVSAMAASSKSAAIRCPAAASSPPSPTSPRSAAAETELKRHQRNAGAARRSTAPRCSKAPSARPSAPTTPRAASSPRSATTCCSRCMPRTCSRMRWRNSSSTPQYRDARRATSTVRWIPPNACWPACWTCRGSTPAAWCRSVQAFRLDDVLQHLVAEFRVLASEHGLRLRLRAVARLGAQRSAAAAPRAAELPRQCGALHGAGAHPARLPARTAACLRIEVWDTGPGIAESDRDVIFEEFRRLDRGGQGLGLGLAIAERIARLLDHRLALRSRVGQGTVFSIEVPRAAAQAASARVVPADVPAAPRSRVLVVDNDPDVLRAMQALLSGWHCEVAAGPRCRRGPARGRRSDAGPDAARLPPRRRPHRPDVARAIAGGDAAAALRDHHRRPQRGRSRRCRRRRLPAAAQAAEAAGAEIDDGAVVGGAVYFAAYFSLLQLPDGSPMPCPHKRL